MKERAGVPLSGLTTIGVGGPARRLVEVESADEAVAVVLAAQRADEQVLVLAGGSNVLVADDGFPGTVVLLRTTGVGVRAMGGGRVAVTVAAGEPWDPFVRRCVAEGWVGVECLSGIPGSCGATPVQNVGAYGQDVSETLTAVTVLDRRTGEVRGMGAAECGLAYRTSRFKHSDDFLVLDVTFLLDVGELSRPLRYGELARSLDLAGGGSAPLADVRDAVLRLRRSKGMVVDPADPDTASCGSFFTNPVLDEDAMAAVRAAAGPDTPPPAWPDASGGVKTSAAWLIQHAGFDRGWGSGPARISSKHTLALTNQGGATAADVVALAREVRAGVQRRFGVTLHPEPVLVGLAL